MLTCHCGIAAAYRCTACDQPVCRSHMVNDRADSICTTCAEARRADAKNQQVVFDRLSAEYRDAVQQLLATRTPGQLVQQGIAARGRRLRVVPYVPAWEAPVGGPPPAELAGREVAEIPGEPDATMVLLDDGRLVTGVKHWGRPDDEIRALAKWDRTRSLPSFSEPTPRFVAAQIAHDLVRQMLATSAAATACGWTPRRAGAESLGLYD